VRSADLLRVEHSATTVQPPSYGELLNDHRGEHTSAFRGADNNPDPPRQLAQAGRYEGARSRRAGSRGPCFAAFRNDRLRTSAPCFVVVENPLSRRRDLNDGSDVGHRCLIVLLTDFDTVGVRGSKPLVPTIESPCGASECAVFSILASSRILCRTKSQARRGGPRVFQELA
jgi:hypothetical protein